jgi:hypothetical protein
LAEKFKMKEEHFTRNRKQPFTATLLFMFNLLRRSLAIEIDGFVRYLNDRLSSGGTRHFTTSAFIQNRKKIDPAVFSHLSGVIIDNFYTPENGALNYLNGIRVLAVDSTKLTLPCTAELKKCYGVMKNQTSVEVVQARASVLYDVLNGLALDATIDSLKKGERELALTHAHRWKKKDLIIYDRGYPSFGFINKHIEQEVDCLIRVTVASFSFASGFVSSGKKSIVTEMRPPENHSFKGKDYNKDSRIKVRLVRVDLPGGEVEVLITTLLDSQKYPAKLFKEIYFLRWGVETFYDELKNKLKIEHFTGYSQVSIQQDFLCAIFISNLQSVVVNDLTEELSSQNQDKKYDYKVNTNLSYGFLKNRVLELLCKEAPLDKVFQQLEALFLQHTVPIRNNRSIDRHVGKYRARIRPKVTKNQKDAI